MVANLLDEWFKMSVTDGLFYAVIGLVFVVLGITLLVFIFIGVGKLMQVVNARKQKPQTIVPPPAAVHSAPEEEDEALAAVIAAAVAAYLGSEQTAKCEFVVKRIKRL